MKTNNFLQKNICYFNEKALPLHPLFEKALIH